jgi:tight adherence protein C
MVWVILAAVFTAIFLITYGLGTIVSRQQKVKERLAESEKVKYSTIIKETEKSSPIIEWLLGWLRYSGRWALSDPERTSKTREMAVQAGFRHPQAPAVFFGSRVLIALLLPIPFLLTFILRGKLNSVNLAFSFFMALGGFFLPNLYLSTKVRQRQNRLDKALPDIMDLLVICIESGLGLNAALQRVADEVRTTYRDFYDELQITCVELRTGIPWDEALDNLGRRTGVQGIRSLVGMMIQTERLGASIGQALRNHGDFTRTQRMLRVEEKAAKLPVKIMFPLVLCILPAMFFVLLGPAVVHVLEKFAILKGGR